MAFLKLKVKEPKPESYPSVHPWALHANTIIEMKVYAAHPAWRLAKPKLALFQPFCANRPEWQSLDPGTEHKNPESRKKKKYINPPSRVGPPKTKHNLRNRKTTEMVILGHFHIFSFFWGGTQSRVFFFQDSGFLHCARRVGYIQQLLQEPKRSHLDLGRRRTSYSRVLQTEAKAKGLYGTQMQFLAHRILCRQNCHASCTCLG